MIEIALSIILLTYLIAGIVKIERFVIFYVPVNFIYDILVFFLDMNSVFPVFRGILFTIISIFLLVKLELPKKIGNIILLLVVFLIHLLFMSVNSTNAFKSFSELLKVFDILIMFLVGVSFYQKGYDLFKLFRYSQIVLWIMIVNIIVSNVIGLGFRGYGENTFYYTGAIYANVWYAPTIIAVIQLILLFSPIRYGTTGLNNFRNNKIRYFLVFVSIVVIVLGGRRSAVMIILINLFVFIFYNANKYKSFLTLSFLGIISIFTSPLYRDIVKSQYANRLEIDEGGLEKENRYKETKLLWSEILSFKNPAKSLFGENPFLTSGNYGGGVFRNRVLHVDINIVLFSAGIFGLLTYLFAYLAILQKFKVLFRPFHADKSYSLVTSQMIFYGLFLSSFVMSFSGGFSAITYRASTFLILGSIIGNIIYRKTTIQIHN